MADAVVVGAGIGGLAVAGGLARHDWNVTLLEREERLRGDRAALLVTPSGVAALRALGLGGGLDAITHPISARGIRRPDGSWLARPDEADAGDAPVVVHGEDLHDTLIAGLGGRIEIRTGVGVRTVRAAASQPPMVSDGAAAWEADLVVGADGIDSVVRRGLAPEAGVAPAGCAAWRAVIPWYRAGDLATRLERLPTGASAGETLGDGHRFRYAMLGARGSAGASSRGGLYWAATVPGAARPEPVPVQLALLRRWFHGWHAPIEDIIAATDPEDLLPHQVRQLWPLPRSFAFQAGSGGYALIGDAAHAMVHHVGHGACLALEDAAALVDAVGSPVRGTRVTEGLRAYDASRRPEAARASRQSRRAGAVLAAPRSSAARTRDAALGLTPGLMGRAASALRGRRRTT